jgi:hypothetical protein
MSRPVPLSGRRSPPGFISAGDTMSDKGIIGFFVASPDWGRHPVRYCVADDPASYRFQEFASRGDAKAEVGRLTGLTSQPGGAELMGLTTAEDIEASRAFNLLRLPPIAQPAGCQFRHICLGEEVDFYALMVDGIILQAVYTEIPRGPEAFYANRDDANLAVRRWLGRESGWQRGKWRDSPFEKWSHWAKTPTPAV